MVMLTKEPVEGQIVSQHELPNGYILVHKITTTPPPSAQSEGFGSSDFHELRHSAAPSSLAVFCVNNGNEPVLHMEYIDDSLSAHVDMLDSIYKMFTEKYKGFDNQANRDAMRYLNKEATKGMITPAIKEVLGSLGKSLNKAQQPNKPKQYELGEGYSVHQTESTPGHDMWDVHHNGQRAGEFQAVHDDITPGGNIKVGSSYMDEQHRGKGVGSKVYQLLANHYGGALSDERGVSPQAAGVYKKLGATKTGQLRSADGKQRMFISPVKKSSSMDLKKLVKSLKNSMYHPDHKTPAHLDKAAAPKMQPSLAGWKAQVGGKWHSVLDVKDSGIPAHQAGGGNMYHLEGHAQPVHQDYIEDLAPAAHVAPQQKPARSLHLVKSILQKRQPLQKDSKMPLGIGNMYTRKKIESVDHKTGVATYGSAQPGQAGGGAGPSFHNAGTGTPKPIVPLAQKKPLTPPPHALPNATFAQKPHEKAYIKTTNQPRGEQLINWSMLEAGKEKHLSSQVPSSHFYGEKKKI